MPAMRLASLLAIAGALGALSRFYLSGWVEKMLGTDFSWGTLAVNLIGCFLLGLLMTVGAEAVGMAKEYRQAVTIGFLGAFTTFSTFGYETVRWLESGAVVTAITYVCASVVLGVLAAWGGVGMGRLVAG